MYRTVLSIFSAASLLLFMCLFVQTSALAVSVDRSLRQTGDKDLIRSALVIGSKEEAFNIIKGQYDASVTLAETQSTDVSFLKENETKLDLGFTIQCNQFYLNHGENYANIAIFEDGYIKNSLFI